MESKDLKFDERGLIPAIVQDAESGKVLMMAYMNKESLEITIKEGRTCFYSRSRQELWRKGATSGNYQEVVSITGDCDGDTLLVKVKKLGPACHTGAESCFFEDIFPQSDSPVAADAASDGGAEFSYNGLYEMLKERKASPKEGSYTSYLFEKGMDKILKKVGEESTEVIIAGAKGDRQEAIFEVADVAYHLMVMMIEMGISIEDITKELASRHVVDKKVKQETMK